MEEELIQKIIKEREKALKELIDKMEHHARMELYWTGYVDALNKILADANDIPIEFAENLGMGFD